MSTQVTEIQNMVLALSAEERLTLVTLIWESLAQDNALDEVDPETLAELVRRNQAFETGADPGYSYDEAMAAVQRVIDEARFSQSGNC